MKRLVICAALIAATPAHAQTGFLMGYMLGSGGTRTVEESALSGGAFPCAAFDQYEDYRACRRPAIYLELKQVSPCWSTKLPDGTWGAANDHWRAVCDHDGRMKAEWRVIETAKRSIRENRQ